MTPWERDLLARTIIGEAGNQPLEGQTAVANVVLNRAKKGGYGSDIGAIVLRPKQFEAWSNPRKLMSYSPDSPEYSTAQAAIDQALLGNDPTNGAVNFYNPELQTQMGRKIPTWAAGDGQRIGDHVFYGGGVQMADNTDPFTKAFGNLGVPAQGASDTGAQNDASQPDADPFTKAFGDVVPSGSSRPATPSASNSPPSVAGESGPAAFVYGAVKGLPIVGPALAGAVEDLAARGRYFTRGEDYATAKGNVNALVENATKQHPIASTAGEITGGVAGTVPIIAAAPSAFGVGLPLWSSILRGGVSGAALGGLDAAARGQDAGIGAVGGAVGGAVANPIGMGVSRVFASKVAPEVARLADKAIRQFNIPLSADQLSQNPMVRFGSSVMNKFPMSGGPAFEGRQRQAFTKAVAGMMGENADSLTPQVMARARTRIGQGFEYAANNTPQIGADTQLGQDLASIVNDIRSPMDRELTAGERKVVEKHLKSVVDLFKSGGGSISGQQYQQLTRRGTALDKAMHSDNPNIRYYAGQIRQALDGALERFAPADAAAKLAEARKQWWVMKTIEDLAEKAPLGQISPALLMGAVRRNAPSVAYQTNNDLMDLARIGQVFMKPPPSSGTGERSWIMHLLESLGMGLGGGYAAHHLAGVGAGLAAPSILGRAAGITLRNPALTNALVRGAMSTAPRLGGQIAAQASVPYVVRKTLPRYAGGGGGP